MSLIGLMLAVALIGLLTWAIVTFIPMPPKFQQLIYVIAGIAVLLYLLSAFGVLGGVRVPTVK